MGRPTYTTRAIVLRKTKLGETDLILTTLAQDGSQIRVVAKGARKPSGSFASRLELYSVVDMLCIQGKSLDMVKEVRLVASNEKVRCDLEHAAAAALVAELLDRVTQVGLENPHLFDMTEAVLAAMGKISNEGVLSLAAAHLLKTFAFCGLRPSFTTCVQCGAAMSFEDQEGYAAFSYRDGGVVCSSCDALIETIPLPKTMLSWAQFFTGSTFDVIASTPIDVSTVFAVLRFCQQWVHEHIGASLKSFNFLFTCGLFEKRASS